MCFPDLKRILVDERDICLAHTLKSAINKFKSSSLTVVGIVGLAHVNRIIKNWDQELDLTQIVE